MTIPYAFYMNMFHVQYHIASATVENVQL